VPKIVKIVLFWLSYSNKVTFFDHSVELVKMMN